MRRYRREKTGKTSNLLVSAVICVLVLAICVVVYVRSNEIKAQNDLKAQEIDRIEQLLEQEQLRAEEIDEYGKFVNTKQFVEKMAREKLGLIYPGELIFKAE